MITDEIRVLNNYISGYTIFLIETWNISERQKGNNNEHYDSVQWNSLKICFRQSSQYVHLQFLNYESQ